MHAHPLKNPKGLRVGTRGEKWESEWTLMFKGEKRIRVQNTEQ